MVVLYCRPIFFSGTILPFVGRSQAIWIKFGSDLLLHGIHCGLNLTPISAWAASGGLIMTSFYVIGLYLKCVMTPFSIRRIYALLVA